MRCYPTLLAGADRFSSSNITVERGWIEPWDNSWRVPQLVAGANERLLSLSAEYEDGRGEPDVIGRFARPRRRVAFTERRH